MGAPDSICVGAQKSGTRWLYEQLQAHPEFWMPPVKEFSFFDRPFPSSHVRRLAENVRKSDDEAERRFAKRLLALETLPEQPLDVYFSLFEPAGGRLTGELTPTYAALPEARIAELAAAMPATKIILMVRDPVDRAWSNLNDAVNDEVIPPEAVMTPSVLVETLRTDRFARVSYPSDAYRRWSRSFPCRFYFLEDVARTPALTRAAILGFLGGRHRCARRPAGPLQLQGGPAAGAAAAADAVRAALVEVFEDEVRQCAAVFGGPAARWPAKHGLTTSPSALEAEGAQAAHRPGKAGRGGPRAARGPRRRAPRRRHQAADIPTARREPRDSAWTPRLPVRAVGRSRLMAVTERSGSHPSLVSTRLMWTACSGSRARAARGRPRRGRSPAGPPPRTPPRRRSHPPRRRRCRPARPRGPGRRARDRRRGRRRRAARTAGPPRRAQAGAGSSEAGRPATASDLPGPPPATLGRGGATLRP